MRKSGSVAVLFCLFSLNAAAYDDSFVISDAVGFMFNIVGGWGLESIQNLIPLIVVMVLFVLFLFFGKKLTGGVL